MINTLAAWLALLTYLAFASRPWRSVLSRLHKRLGDLTVGLFLLPFLMAVNFQPTLSDLARLVACLVVPMLFLRLRHPSAKPFDFYHILAILAIWIPVEPDLFTLFLDLIVPNSSLSARFPARSWWPQANATLAPGVGLPVHTLTAVLLACYLFLVYRPLSDVGFSWRLRRRDVALALIGVLGFSVIGLPIGLGLGFIQPNLDVPDWPTLALSVAGGYLLVALPEELLFRGMIQNLLQKRLQHAWLALPLAAVIFGMAHLNNSTPGFPAPNWAYVLMASLAGLCYGWVWWRTKTVTASAITHMLVNLVWSVLFH
jgi:membrane protease YdiL (CAAX protease family)